MKIPVILALLLFSGLISQAQIERKPAARADSLKTEKAIAEKEKPAVKEVLRQLDLTREQRIRLKQIRDDNQAKKAAIENNTGLNDEQKKKQLKELKKEQANKLQSILTEEQKEKFRSLRAGSAGDQE